MGFSRQEYWSGLPCPPLGDLPDPGIGPVSLVSPASAGVFFTTSTTLYDGLNWYTSQNSTFLLFAVCVPLTIPSSQKHPIFQDSKTCCYLICAYERKKILPIKLRHTIIRCIPTSDMLKRWGAGGKHVLQLMKHRMSAAVNSDIIEDSGFQPQRSVELLSSLPHWFHCVLSFQGWDCLTCLKCGDDKPCVDQEYDITLGCPGWEARLTGLCCSLFPRLLGKMLQWASRWDKVTAHNST